MGIAEHFCLNLFRVRGKRENRALGNVSRASLMKKLLDNCFQVEGGDTDHRVRASVVN
jgi:hypothetical protein